MKVADLQSFIRSLTQPLLGAGARELAEDWTQATHGLEPFKNLGVKEFTGLLAHAKEFAQGGVVHGLTTEQFADFLTRAEEFGKTGAVKLVKKPKGKGKGTASSQGVDPEQIRGLAQHVLALYEQATDEAVQFATIDAEIKKLDKSLNKEGAIALAREIGIAGSLPTKTKALEEIHRKIAGRKESFERVQF